MYKKILLGCMMALCALSANAQFEAGKIYLNLSSSSLSLSYSKNDKLRFDVGATAGIYVANSWMILAQANYNHKRLMYSSFGDKKVHQDEVIIGVGARYYIAQNGLYLGLATQFSHHEQTNDNLFLTPEIGYAFFVNQYITLEPAVYYQMSLNNFADASTVGLKLGVGFYF